MAVLIQSIESIEIHRQNKKIKKRLRKKQADRIVNGARWACTCGCVCVVECRCRVNKV